MLGVSVDFDQVFGALFVSVAVWTWLERFVANG